MRMHLRISTLFLCAMLPAEAASRHAIGLAQDLKTPIEIQVPDGYNGSGGVLIIGGLNGEDDSSRAVREELAKSPQALAIAVANPLKSALQFPPAGVAYRENTESHVLWRWIGLHAPDQVKIVGDDPAGLAAALMQNKVAGVGSVLTSAPVGTLLRPTAAEELARRRARTPRDLANELSQYFGHDFGQLTYIPGMALIAQMRLGNVAEVEQLAAPYLQRDNLARANSLTLAGHLVFAELARRRGDTRYVQLVKKAADLGFDASGKMLESMPFHQEMSDSYFMAGPITAIAGALTGDRKYFDMVAQHFRFLDKLVLRQDGLYRHSPLSEAAWGRGNAFAALGLALSLSEFPPSHADYPYVRDSYRRLMINLARFQDEEGMWHEIIDNPASYQETSATMMIATAMLKGIRRGWIEANIYRPRVDRAWNAALARIGPQGEFVDVCESTNKQLTYDDYLKRAASLGRDDRAGGMALLFATELAGLE